MSRRSAAPGLMMTPGLFTLRALKSHALRAWDFQGCSEGLLLIRTHSLDADIRESLGHCEHSLGIGETPSKVTQRGAGRLQKLACRDGFAGGHGCEYQPAGH